MKRTVGHEKIPERNSFLFLNLSVPLLQPWRVIRIGVLAVEIAFKCVRPKKR